MTHRSSALALFLLPAALMAQTPAGVAATAPAGVAATAPAGFTPPPTPAKPVQDVVHGVTLTDPYRWLEDNTNADVVKWTRAQHDAATAWLDKNAPAVPGLRDELTRFIDRTVTSPPWFYKGREFFTRRVKGDAQSKLYTRIDGREVLIFDPLKLDPSGKSALSGQAISRSANVMAVGVQVSGDELPTQYFIDTRTGKEVFPPLREVWSVSWTADEKVVHIQQRTKEQITKQLPLFSQRHTLGTDHLKSPVVLRMNDAKEYGGVFEYEYAPYTLTTVGVGRSSRYSIARTGSGAAPREIFAERDAQASIQMLGETIYALTNAGAPNYRIMRATTANPEFKDWRDLIPEQKDAVLESFVVTKQNIVVREKRELMTRVRVYDLDGKFVRDLPAPEFGSVASLSFDREADVLYASLTTFNAPFKLYKLDGKTLTWNFMYQDEMILDTQNIETRLVYATSKDGTKIPIFLSHKKGIKLDGSNPTLVYGYGGFNIGIQVRYLGSRIALINRGVVYADVGLRGGDEFGRAWHRAGMLGNKQNVYDDFYSAAEWLVKNGYTTSKKMVAYGGSNGGLLTGAAATQRPELFNGIISSVPLLDMVRYHKFRIARYWIPEYGDPDKAEDFAWLLAYSPYHNIRAGVNLPTTLVIAGENDTRVDPLHAKKFVALAQNNVGQTSPVLLKMDYGAGHGAGKSTQQLVDDIELWQRFVFAVTK
jgi:prolyl oligopeptidase